MKVLSVENPGLQKYSPVKPGVGLNIMIALHALPTARSSAVAFPVHSASFFAPASSPLSIIQKRCFM